MRFIYCGKIKDVYEDGFYFVFYFKDLVFGEDGREDIGGNGIVGERRGKGSIVFDEIEFFFCFFEEKGIRMYFVEWIDERRVCFLRVERILLEVIYCEFVYGSFLRCY